MRPPSRYSFLLPLAVVGALAALVVVPSTAPESEALAPTSAPVPAAAPAPAATTRHVVVRPVTRAGRPARGWTVQRLGGEASCSGTSPAAVSSGITACFPTVLALRACWKSQRHTALCVRDARARTLYRIRYSGTYPVVRARRTPSPMNLVLGTGAGCVVRFGGAWGAPPSHPQWVGFYTCTGEGSVFGPADSRDGIDRTRRPWQVRVWRERSDDVVRRLVVTDYYVGTAA